MREIRFREWSKTVCVMYSHEDCGQFKPSRATQLDDWFNNPDFVMMQYTGLKDKNGTYIFEGDIIRNGLFNHNECIVPVVFRDGAFLIENRNELATFYDMSKDEWEHIEVIGNVYETPHLCDTKCLSNYLEEKLK